ncbi:hypothetical protein [Bacillus xiapuensis]|uniref:hypothetical protein n=1 Tax=Bacillus xiapuensis TaxID=2014075 RepID=UPI000C23400E|nr:hypothetical protein [Bacillus xiapuensis]
MYKEFVERSRNLNSINFLANNIDISKIKLDLKTKTILDVIEKRESFRYFSKDINHLNLDLLEKIVNHGETIIKGLQIENYVEICFIDNNELINRNFQGVYYREDENWVLKTKLDKESISRETLYLQTEMHDASGVFFFEWKVNNIPRENNLGNYRYMNAISGLLGHQLSLKATELELKGTIFAGITLVEYQVEILKSFNDSRLPIFAFSVE